MSAVHGASAGPITSYTSRSATADEQISSSRASAKTASRAREDREGDAHNTRTKSDSSGAVPEKTITEIARGRRMGSSAENPKKAASGYCSGKRRNRRGRS